MVQRVAAWAYGRAQSVMLGWLLVSIIGITALFHVDSRLTAITVVPGSPSATADATVQQAFGEGFAGTFSVIYPFGEATAAEIDEFKLAATSAIARVPDLEIRQLRAIAGTLYVLVGSDLPLMEASARTPDLRSALAAEGLAKAMVTGAPALEHDVRPVLADDLLRGAIVGLALVLCILLLAFGRSRLVIVPLLAAAATIATAILGVYLLAAVIPMVLYVPNIVELVGLGVAIDYSVLLLHRYRQERTSTTGRLALDAAYAAAGRTVWWAAVTAAISLGALAIIPVPLVQSLAIAGVLVPLVAMTVTCTLIPALLRVLDTYEELPESRQGLLGRERMWGSLLTRVAQRPRMISAIGLVAIIAMGTPALAMRVAPASLTAVPQDVPAAEAVRFLEDRLGPGAITPHELVIDVAEGSATSEPNDRARQAFANWVSDRAETFGVFTDTSAGYVDSSDRYQRIFVIGKTDFADERTAAFVRTLRAVDLGDFGYADDARLFVAGAPAQGLDFLDALRVWFPGMALLALLAAVVALRTVLRSTLMALCSVGLNLLTLASVYGMLVMLFQWWPFDVGLERVDRLESWTLVLLFALLFALSMDYQVFVLTRIRERFEQHRNVRTAVLEGTERTAGVVSIAAVALVAALSGLILSGVSGLQQLGIGLAIGVLLDATVIRLVLLPGLMLALADRIWRSA